MEPQPLPSVCEKCQNRPPTPGFSACRPCLLKQALQTTLPLIDYRQQEMTLDYPPSRLFILHDFKRAHAAAARSWIWKESFDPDGPAIASLLPIDQLNNHIGQNPSGTPISGGKILFGFENMWNVREPMFVVQDDGEAKIYWQRAGEDWREARAPEGSRLLRHAISPGLFYQRIKECFGAPPETWPLHDVFDAETRWGACLQRAGNGDQVFFRVNRGCPQVAYSGTVMGMYDALGLVQLIVGPPGKELYTERFEGEREMGENMLEKIESALGQTEVVPGTDLDRFRAMVAARMAANDNRDGEDDDDRRSTRAILGSDESDSDSELSSAPDLTQAMTDAFEGVAVTSTERPTTVDSGVGSLNAPGDMSGLVKQA